MATFVSHLKSKFWSDINTLKPNELALNSHKNLWFDCQCGYPFVNNLKNINLLNRWWAYCANKKLCSKDKKCKICFDKCLLL
jgi:hypothetical protein